MRIVVFILFVLMTGKVFCQSYFSINPKIGAKMSNHRWNEFDNQNNNEYYVFGKTLFSIYNPLRIGVEFKYNKEFSNYFIGVYDDGVSYDAKVFTSIYQNVGNKLTPDIFRIQSKVYQGKLSFGYIHTIPSKLKTNKFSLGICISLHYRTGSKSVESVGGLGFQYPILDEYTSMRVTSTSYTSKHKRAISIGTVLLYKLSLKEKYFCDLEFNVNFSRNNLYFEKVDVQIFKNSDLVNSRSYKIDYLCSNFTFTISRPIKFNFNRKK